MRGVLRPGSLRHDVLHPGSAGRRVRPMDRPAARGSVRMTIAIEQPKEQRGILEWITTTNHKNIGLLYIGTTLVFFLAGGIMALLIRTELAQPGLQFLSKQTYDELFTIHGTTMIFLFIAPMGLGLANYFVPL